MFTNWRIQMLGGAMIRNIFYGAAFVIFMILMAIKAFAFWIPPILDFPPVLMHPPHMEGGIEPAIEDIKREMQKSPGDTIDEEGMVIHLA